MTSWCDSHGDYPLSRLNHVRCVGCGTPVRCGAQAADLAVDWIAVEDADGYFFEGDAADTTGPICRRCTARLLAALRSIGTSRRTKRPRAGLVKSAGPEGRMAGVSELAEVFASKRNARSCRVGQG